MQFGSILQPLEPDRRIPSAADHGSCARLLEPYPSNGREELGTSRSGFPAHSGEGLGGGEGEPGSGFCGVVQRQDQQVDDQRQPAAAEGELEDREHDVDDCQHIDQ